MERQLKNHSEVNPDSQPSHRLRPYLLRGLFVAMVLGGGVKAAIEFNQASGLM